MSKLTYFTSECVSPGHPDKIADQISDAVLDACLEQDPNSRVACEVFCTTGQVIVGGEITTQAYVDVQEIVRNKVKEIGYRPGMGFDSDCGVLNAIHSQSPDIALGVDIGGAGDQGMVFGGACKETPELMPLALMVARGLTTAYTRCLRDRELSWLRPDAKSQVTVVYDGDKVVGIDTVLMSVQHNPDVTHEEICAFLASEVISPVLTKYGFNLADVNHLYVNPTGRFVIGGPHGDTGLTGRKIIVDTYGGYFHHGGGAFSGKDCSKVDRSAAYAARWVAKNLVAGGFADKCEVQISYGIGMRSPISIKVDTFGTSRHDDGHLTDLVQMVFNLTPEGIAKSLRLRDGIFKHQDLAAFGHLGRTDIELPWESVDKVSDLKRCALELAINS